MRLSARRGVFFTVMVSGVVVGCYPFPDFAAPRDPEVIGVVADVELGEDLVVTYRLDSGEEVVVNRAEQPDRRGVLEVGSLLFFAEADPDVDYGAGRAPEGLFDRDDCFLIGEPARMEDDFIVFAHGLRLPNAEGFEWASEPDQNDAWYDQLLTNFCVNGQGEVVQQGSPP